MVAGRVNGGAGAADPNSNTHVVVRDVVDHETLELALVPDDGAVEDLASQTADPAFGEGVGYRGMNRGLENLEALATEDLVEVVDELAGAVS